MITYREYLANSTELHHEYFLQFVTEDTKRFVLSHIGLPKLLQSTYHYLNDVVDLTNGHWVWDSSPCNEPLMREAGNSLTRADRTCVGKAAAKELIREYKETTDVSSNPS